MIACVLILLLAGTSVFFALEARKEDKNVAPLEAKIEALTQRNRSLERWLDDIDIVAEKSIKIIERFYPEEKSSGWQKLVIDTLETIRDLIDVARELE